jgi:hypothetical protein
MDLRLTLLLKHLSRRSFKLAPNGVGLKTMITAREEGFIDLEFDTNAKSARGRLTDRGWRLQQEIRKHD